jgi:hypothetical protein
MPRRESRRFHSTDAKSPQLLTIRKIYERPAPNAYSEATHGSSLRAEINRRKGYHQVQHHDCQDGFELIPPGQRGTPIGFTWQQVEATICNELSHLRTVRTSNRSSPEQRILSPVIAGAT